MRLGDGTLVNVNDTFVLQNAADSPGVLVTAGGTFTGVGLAFNISSGYDANGNDSWTPVAGKRCDGTALESTPSGLSSPTAWWLPTVGAWKIQVVLTAIASGSVNVVLSPCEHATFLGYQEVDVAPPR